MLRLELNEPFKRFATCIIRFSRILLFQDLFQHTRVERLGQRNDVTQDVGSDHQPLPLGRRRPRAWMRCQEPAATALDICGFFFCTACGMRGAVRSVGRWAQWRGGMTRVRFSWIAHRSRHHAPKKKEEKQQEGSDAATQQDQKNTLKNRSGHFTVDHLDNPE